MAHQGRKAGRRERHEGTRRGRAEAESVNAVLVSLRKIMKTKFAGFAVLLLALAPGGAWAARAWLLPSQTILARSGGWVTVDAAMADDLFSFNQGAMAVDSLVVTGPDGQAVAAQNIAKGKTRSSVDLELRQAGSYRLAIADD